MNNTFPKTESKAKAMPNVKIFPFKKGKSTMPKVTTFEKWLRSAPTGIDMHKPVPVTVQIELPASYWTILAEGAAANSVSLEKALLWHVNMDSICEWFGGFAYENTVEGRRRI